MTEIAFHFGVPDRTAYLCRLLRKAVRQSAQVVVTGPSQELAGLDRALWSFDPLEFVPHLRPAPGQAVAPRLRDTPVWLLEDPVDDLAGVSRHEVLVNLCVEPPGGFERYARVVEVVSTEPDDRSAARERWKHYTARGYAIERHEVGG